MRTITLRRAKGVRTCPHRSVTDQRRRLAHVLSRWWRQHRAALIGNLKRRNIMKGRSVRLKHEMKMRSEEGQQTLSTSLSQGKAQERGERNKVKKRTPVCAEPTVSACGKLRTTPKPIKGAPMCKYAQVKGAQIRALFSPMITAKRTAHIWLLARRTLQPAQGVCVSAPAV